MLLLRSQMFEKLGANILLPPDWLIFGKLASNILVLLSWLILRRVGLKHHGTIALAVLKIRLRNPGTFDLADFRKVRLRIPLSCMILES